MTFAICKHCWNSAGIPEISDRSFWATNAFTHCLWHAVGSDSVYVLSSPSKIIKISQKATFGDEVSGLSVKGQVSNKSRILNLRPYLDESGVLRVGGRLGNSSFPENKRHPIILDAKSPLTKLIFECEHERLLHAGPQQLLASIRERYWPVSGRVLAKSVFKGCLNCFKVNPQPMKITMGQLPE